jgi:hypothetical protein
MRQGLTNTLMLGAGAAAGALLMAVVLPAAAGRPTASAYKALRSAHNDGAPDLNGIWQSFATANWDIRDHGARQGPSVALGAVFSVPPGQSVVERDEIPYQPWALAQKNENAKTWATNDPEIKCYLPGIPRATYMPYPFQIIQGPEHILISYEFATDSRIIYMKDNSEAPFDSWQGWSRGHWERDTLVVDVTGFNDRTWFDRAGDFHSDALHVIERYTPIGPDHLSYEAAIEDPKVFTRPWKMKLILYRRKEANLQLLEYKCVEFVEELMYGDLRKKTPTKTMVHR